VISELLFSPIRTWAWKVVVVVVLAYFMAMYMGDYGKVKIKVD
jgi:hypothetical protein